MFNLGDKVHYKHPNGNKYLGQICIIHPKNSYCNENKYVIFPLETFPSTHGGTHILDAGICDSYLNNNLYQVDPAIRTTPHYNRFILEPNLVLAQHQATMEPEFIISKPEVEEDRGGFKYI